MDRDILERLGAWANAKYQTALRDLAELHETYAAPQEDWEALRGAIDARHEAAMKPINAVLSYLDECGDK